MKVLQLIVARGGSKSVKNKNLRKLGGLSLIGYKAAAARKSSCQGRLIISTDSAEMQEEALRHGVEVLFTRPDELATDDASVLDVIRHAMDWMEFEAKETFDAILLLEPSSPFATSDDIDKALEIFTQRAANVVVGMRAMEVNSTFVGPMDAEGRIKTIIDKIGDRKALGRQAMEQEYTMNGCLYLFRWSYFRERGVIYGDRERTYGFPMDRFKSIEIDEPVDLHWAEFLLEKGYVDANAWRD